MGGAGQDHGDLHIRVVRGAGGRAALAGGLAAGGGRAGAAGRSFGVAAARGTQEQGTAQKQRDQSFHVVYPPLEMKYLTGHTPCGRGMAGKEQKGTAGVSGERHAASS